jgi:hypothetical protein
MKDSTPLIHDKRAHGPYCDSDCCYAEDLCSVQEVCSICEGTGSYPIESPYNVGDTCQTCDGVGWLRKELRAFCGGCGKYVKIIATTENSDTKK